MIEIQTLHMSFGGLQAVDGVSLKINEGSITGLIGPNGAGKTTLFNCIAGVFTPSSGDIYLDGKNVTGLAPHNLFAMGMVRTFQIAHEFPTLTSRENLMLVAPQQIGENLIYNWLQPARVKKEESKLRQKANEVLKFLQITEVADELAGNLSGGQKKLLELGRTMMLEAKVVLLDEAGAGVNRSLLKTLEDAIVRLQKEQNYTFFVIEHDMEFISRLCDPVIVMAEGSILMQGSIHDVQKNEAVIDAYLGSGRDS